MTLQDPIVIATIRGLLTALGQAAFTGLTTYQVTGNAGDSAVVGALSFLVALGIRGGVEGVWDQRKGPRPGFNDPVPPGMIVRRPNAAKGNWPEVTLQEVPLPGPIPPIDFDEPYHYAYDNETRHPSHKREDCPWCLAESQAAT